MAALTLKQLKFIEEYFKDFNGTQAAIRAGYSVKTANEQATRLLANVSISRAIDEEKAQAAARTGINADRILREYARIAFADIRGILEWDADGVTLKSSEELTADDAATIGEITEIEFKGKTTLSVKLHGKEKALYALAKHLGLTPDRTELTGKDGKPIEIANTFADIVKAAQARLATAAGTKGTDGDDTVPDA
jgi:phage terminase small subunit